MRQSRVYEYRGAKKVTTPGGGSRDADAAAVGFNAPDAVANAAAIDPGAGADAEADAEAAAEAEVGAVTTALARGSH